MGINTRSTKDGILCTSVQGTSDGKEFSSMESSTPKPTVSKQQVFIGVNSSNEDHLYDKLTLKEPINCDAPKYGTVHITRVFAELNLSNQLIFCAGTRSMRKLASQGYWVNGSSDGMGEEELISFKNSELLKFMTPEIKQPWGVYTHPNGSTNLGDAIPSYEMKKVETSTSFDDRLKATEVFFWTSFRQFQTYLDKYPEIRNKTHCCGMGKTYQQATESGYNFIAFSGMKEFKEWIKR